MSLSVLTDFFMWYTIINAAILIFWTLMVMSAPDFVYRLQGKFFKVTREQFDLVVYGYLGLFKALFVMFNLVPLIALLIVG